MGYRLVIGRARNAGEVCDDAVEPCAGYPADVHQDDWEGEPGPVRLPTYSDWGEVLLELPELSGLWRRMQKWAAQDGLVAIPCRRYEQELGRLEGEASRSRPMAAARELWFVRWSREALRRYRDEAVFEVPGEWR
jgi:hypothetical protein